eukprot:symbB.v1.2.011372.t1/scaffold763.1/size179103/7
MGRQRRVSDELEKCTLRGKKASGYERRTELQEDAESQGGSTKGGSGSRYSDVKMNAVLQLQCVALKCHNGKHIKTETNGDLRASSAVVKDAEKFDLTHHQDGRISLKCCTGKYVKVDKNGEVKGAGSAMDEESKFGVEFHEGGLLSLRSCYGYVAAEANGKIRANREQIGAWEVFQVKDRSGSQKTCAPESNDQPENDESWNFYDAFCSGTHDELRTLFKIEDLSIPKGSKIAVVGANGCGKSTLLSYLSGREKPKEGEIRLQLG